MTSLTVRVAVVLTMLALHGFALEHDNYEGTLSKLQKSRRQLQDNGAYELTNIIELKDGAVIHGKIIEQTLEEHVVIESIDGNLVVCSMKDVKTTTSESQTFELKDGSVIRGKIVEQTPEGHVVIESIDGNLVVCSMEDVKTTTSESQTFELKDGSVIRGKIIEQTPGEHVVIKTLDGNLFVCSMKDIKMIIPESQVSALSVGPKNPGLAFGLSLIHPGMGQYYNEQYVKGSLFLAVDWCAKIVMLSADDNNDRIINISKDNFILFSIGFIGFAVNSLVAAYDARSSAKDINFKYQSLNTRFSIKPSDSTTDLGVTVSWKF